MTVTVDRLTRHVAFIVPGFEPFTMHMMQAYHLAKFLFGFEIKEEHRTEHDDDDTKPDAPNTFDLSEHDPD